jgi:hypothetical protein
MRFFVLNMNIHICYSKIVSHLFEYLKYWISTNIVHINHSMEFGMLKWSHFNWPKMVHCTKDCTRICGSIIFEIFNKHSSCYVGILKFINSSTQHWGKLSTIHSPNTFSLSSNWHFFQIIFHDIDSTLSWSHKSPMFLKHLMYNSCALKIDMPKTLFQNFLDYQMLTIMIELAFVSGLNVKILITIFHSCIIWPSFRTIGWPLYLN